MIDLVREFKVFVEQFNTNLPVDRRIDLSDHRWPLIGEDSPLDSYDITEFLLGLEDSISKSLGRRIEIFKPEMLDDEKYTLTIKDVVELMATYT